MPVDFNSSINQSVQFDVSLERALGGIDGLNFDFDFDLPGLGFELENAGIDLEFFFKFDLGVGIDVDEGVFLAFDPNKENDLELGVRATLPDGFEISGTLLLLDMSLTDADTDGDGRKSLLDGVFEVDIIPDDPSGRIPLNDLVSLNGFDMQAKFDGELDLDLRFTAGFGSASFPSMRGDFNIDWDFAEADTAAADFAGSPEIEFDNIQLGMGTFLSDVLGPVTNTIKEILDPLQPILDVLTAPIPVISDLGGPITLLDVAALFGYAEYVDFVDAVIDIKALADSISGMSGDQLWIDLGAFSIDGESAQDTSARGQLSPEQMQLIDYATQKTQIQNEATPSQKAAFDSAVNVSGGGFGFPILENPASAFGLLMGKDVALFTYDMPKLDMKFMYSQYFPIIGPLGARIGGDVGATFDFAFGYDTHGITKYRETGDLASLFEGFYVSDRLNADGTGVDVPEITLSGGLFAAAELNVVVARAGVGGGVRLDVFFDLHDNDQDGRVRGKEILDNITNLGLIHVFDVTGEFSAELFAYVKIGFPTPFGFVTILDERFDLAKVTLLDFSLPRPENNPPALAAVSSGELNLTTAATSGDDRVTVSFANNQVVIGAQGRSESYSNVTSVVLDTGAGNDTIEVDSSLPASISVELFGGPGNDTLRAGSFSATLHGGLGNDEIVGSPLNDTIFGDADNDNLSGGAGDDTIHGGVGMDVIRGDHGDDSLFGGDQDDQIFGGRGADRIEGGKGADELHGELGADVLIGGEDSDILIGGRGDDILLGDLGTVVVATRAVSNLSGAWSDRILGG